MGNTGKFGWLFGLLTGTVLGVLFAPRKGKDLRNKMKQDRKRGRLGVEPLKNDISLLGKSVHGVISDLYKEVSENEVVKDTINTGKEYLGDYVDEVREQFDDFKKHSYNPAKNQVQKNLDEKVKSAKEVLKRVKREGIVVEKKLISKTAVKPKVKKRVSKKKSS